MKHLKYIIWSLLLLSLQVINVSAICTYKEQALLNETAGKIKATYDILEEGTGEYGYYGEDSEVKQEITEYNTYTNIANINDNIYIKLTNLTENNEKIYRFSDSSNGIIRFKNSLSIQIYEYKIEVFSNISNCNNELLKTINFVIPKFNDVSELGICADIPNYKYCQTFISEDLSSAEIFSKVSSYIEEKTSDIHEEEQEQETSNKIDYKLFIIIVSVFVFLGIIGGLIYLIVKHKKERI